MNSGIDVWGVFPCIREFNIVIWVYRFDRVDFYMCIFNLFFVVLVGFGGLLLGSLGCVCI